MRLLVSVRSPDEVAAALGGGADIVDAKDPARGALGPVAADVLAAIDERVPVHVPLSVALGDAGSAERVNAVVSALRIRRWATAYVKLAFDALCGVSELLPLLRAAAAASARHAACPRLIAVAYADAGRAAQAVLRAAQQAGAAGILLDTAAKDGRTLLDFWSESLLRDWVRAGRAAGLEVALAGSIGLRDLARVVALEPDIIGVRGAACTGGRAGSVEAVRVRALRALLPMEPAAIAANHETRATGYPQQSISK